MPLALHPVTGRDFEWQTSLNEIVSLHFSCMFVSYGFFVFGFWLNYFSVISMMSSNCLSVIDPSSISSFNVNMASRC